MKRDLVFQVVYTVLLAVIAFYTVNTLRVIEHETSSHRLRNEAESLCQLEAQQAPFEERQNLNQWLKVYEDCVFRRSGIGPPEGLKD